MYCPKCGYELAEDEKVCPACGLDLNSDSESDKAAEGAETIIAEEVEAEPVGEEDITAEADDDIEVEVYEVPADENDSAKEECEGCTCDCVEGNCEECDYAECDCVEGGTEFPESTYIPEAPKSNPFGKIILAVIAVIVIGAAAVAGFYEIAMPSSPNPVLSLLGLDSKSDSAPTIFTKTEDGVKNVYYNNGQGERFVTALAENQSGFQVNTDFVTGGDNVFYIMNSTLTYFTPKTDVPVQVDSSALPGTLVIAADGKTVLFVKKDESDNNVLCKYTLGGKVEAIETLPLIKVDTSYPLYGFADGTKNAWYIKKADTSAENGELFLEKGSSAPKSIATEVSRAFYCSADGKNAVYLSVKDDKAQLMMTAKNGEAVMLSSDYNDAHCPVFVNKPSKGFIHLGDIVVSDNGLPSGTLYYRPFGKDALSIDTAVNAYQYAGGDTNYYDNFYFNNGALWKNSADMLYQKTDGAILLSKNGSYGTVPAGFNYSGSQHSFGYDVNAVAYTDENDKTLKYSTYGKNGWSAPVKIAEKADHVQINRNGNLVAYVVSSETEGAMYTTHLYDVKKNQIIFTIENSIGMQYFGGKNGDILYYADNYNQETYSMRLNKYEDGGTTVIDEAVAEFTTTSNGDLLALKLNPDNNKALDMFTFENGKQITLGTALSGLSLY